MKLRSRSLVAVAMSMSSLACYAPEKFDATLSIDKNRQYQFSYDGTIVHGLALMQLSDGKSLSASDEKSLASATTELRREPGIQSAEYIGRGRFRIQFKQSGGVRPGEKFFLDLIRFSAAPNGAIRVHGAELSPGFRKDAKSLGLALNGTIRLDSELPILEHNAASTPWFGKFGGYKWTVSVDQSKLPTALIQ